MFDVEAYLKTQLSHVERSGKECRANCPQCGKPKWYASTERPFGFICFAGSCGLRGKGIIDLIVAVEGLSRREAERRILRYDKKTREPTTVSLEATLASLRAPVEPEAPVDVPLPAEYAPCFDGERWKWPSYLTTRGITREAAQHFQIGYARGGRYRGRVILPFECPHGSAFVGRDTTGKSTLKYLSPKKEEGYAASRLVYGWPRDESWEGTEVFIVEGPLDVVRMWQHGLPALSLLGKVPSINKLDMLVTLRASGFIVMLDPEEERIKMTRSEGGRALWTTVAPTETAARLRAIADRVWVAKLPDGVDPGSSTSAQVREAYLGAREFKGRRERDLSAVLDAARRVLEK